MIHVKALQDSQARLRTSVTYTCVQLGWLLSVMSCTPLFAWAIGVHRWWEVATAFGKATTYLIFAPLGCCLMMLGLFPNDHGPVGIALALVSIGMALYFALALLGNTNDHISDRPILVLQNTISATIMFVAILLLVPAWSNRIRCCKPRTGKLSALVCAPPFTCPQRLERMWLSARFAVFSLGLNYLVITLLRAYSPGVDQWSRVTTSQAEFISQMLVGGSMLVNGFLFSPKCRLRLQACLGRRARPSPSDQLAAQHAGFKEFYGTQALIDEEASGPLPTVVEDLDAAAAVAV